MNERYGEIGKVDEGQLRLLVRDWRRGRADRNLLQAIQDGYIMVFAVLLIGAMLVNSVIHAQQSVAGCDTPACSAARDLLPWSAAASFLALSLVAARMFGPVLASTAEGFWILDGDVDRRKVLSGRLVAAVTIALVGGAGMGALVAALVGGGAPEILTWSLATGFGCFGLVAFAAAEQGVERRWITSLLLWLVGLLGVVGLVILVGIGADLLPSQPLEALSLQIAWLVAAVGLLLGLGSIVPAWLRLRQLRRQRLTSGGALLSGMQGAAFGLDFALMRDILMEHQARLKGFVQPTRGAGGGVWAIVLRDLQRLWRHPRPLVLWVASMAVPYGVAALGVDVLNPALSALVLMAALIGFCNSLRVLTRSKGLQRCFPFSMTQIRQATMVVPAGLALIWAVATMPAFGGYFTGSLDLMHGFSQSLICAAAGVLAAFRWVTAKPANYGGPIVSVGVGALPPGMMFSIFRGIDIVSLVTLPLLLGLPQWVSFAIAIIAFMVLRSGFTQESLMDAQQEQQRLLELEKQKRAGAAKVKVQRRR